jgi:hypothetical protein
MRPMRSRLSLTGVQHAGRRLDLAGVDAHEGQRADERVVHDLERQRRERLVVGADADDLLVAAGVVPLTGGTSSGDGR